MADYKVNFKQLKSRVGIEEVAYSLGYRVDRKAGVGRYFEMVLGDSNRKVDTIIVRNSPNKEMQSFFRRDGSKGDVITLIRENLNSFFVDGKDDWQKVAKVMARFANMPEPDFKEEYTGRNITQQVFDPSRYKVKGMDLDRLPPLFTQRGISADTVRVFAPFISLVQDKRNENFTGFNVGFPYTDSRTIGAVGYELRGMGGYKSKAAGTNSSTASWVADFSNGFSHAVKAVFFCESALDAMAFYQMNRARLDRDIAFVSLGGTFSDGQVRDVMKRFPNARLFDCFDNDIAGRIYGVRLIALAEDKPFKISRTDTGVTVELAGKTRELDLDRSLTEQLAETFSIRGKATHWPPPKNFKDWNDCLQGKTMEPEMMPGKSDRDRNLSERRNLSLKL